MEDCQLAADSTVYTEYFLYIDHIDVLLLYRNFSGENLGGAFRYNVYIFSGILMTIIGAFILNFVLGGNVLFGGLFSTYYISMSIFLAYAATYPDNQVLFMMIIPFKNQMAWCRLCVDDSGRDDSVRMGGKSCDYLFFDELYYSFFS